MASNIVPGNIDGTFPIAGQDNSSQGFRDNFTAIKNNFEDAKTEIEDLIKNILIRVGRIDSKALMQKGVKPGPELGKLIKDWSDLNLEPMTPEKYNETLDKFLKEKGY